MGYDIDVSLNFSIPAEKVSAAETALRNYFLRDKDEEERDELAAELAEEKLKDLLDRLSELTFYTEDTGTGLAIEIQNNPNRHTDEWQGAFEALAPFAVEGSRLDFHGEDNCMWRWVVKKGELDTEDSETVYGRDMEAPKAIRAIVEALYPNGKGKAYRNPTVLKIEEILKEHGFGPYADLTDMEALASAGDTEDSDEEDD